MINLERTVIDENKVNQIIDKIEDNNGNGQYDKTESNDSNEEIQLLLMSFEQRLSKIEKNSYGNRIVPLKEFNDIGRLLEGDEVKKFVDKVRLFRKNGDVLILRTSYKQLYENSIKMLDEGEMVLNKMVLERDGIKNLLGRIQESMIK